MIGTPQPKRQSLGSMRSHSSGRPVRIGGRCNRAKTYDDGGEEGRQRIGAVKGEDSQDAANSLRGGQTTPSVRKEKLG